MSLDPALVAARRQLAAFRDVATAVGSELELEPLLRSIIDAVCTVVGSERASLFLLDEATGEVVSRVLTGHAAEIRVGPGKGIVGAVVASGQAVRLDDAWADPRFSRDVDADTGFRTRTLLAVPLRAHDGTLKGVVQALNKTSGAFDVDDEQLLEAMGAELTVALERARLFDELRRKKAEADRRVQELDLLVEIDRALLGADGVQALLDVVVERAAALLPARAASVAVLNARTSALVYRAAAGDDAIVGRAIPSDSGFSGAAFSGRCTIRVDDAARDARHTKRPGHDDAFVAGPLLVAPLLVAPLRDAHGETKATRGSDNDGRTTDRVLGVIVVTREHGAPAFHTSDERLLQLIANRVAFAVDAEEQKEKARARDRLESMGRMLAGIVHDFRTPMTVISGYVQLMASTDDDNERKQSAEHVLQGTEQMSAMIKQLLSFARGDSEVLLRKVWVENFVGDAAELLRRLVADGAVDFVVDMKSRAAVRVDELKLKRALANLVKNAREALDSRGPGAARGRIELSAVDDGDVVVFRVADNGPGLAPAIEERLFQEFATFGKENGTGLGLALVKRIAEEHGGNVVVENRPGAGCAFALRLPKA
jgi:signal transduction histidine kinase